MMWWPILLFLLCSTTLEDSTVKAFVLNGSIRIRSTSANVDLITFKVSKVDEEKQDAILPTIRRMPTRYRGRVAYDGSMFKGWQVQAGTKGKGNKSKTTVRTVQGEIERVLSTRFNRPVKIVGAGRTDAGVHARGQAFHFDLYSDLKETEDEYCEEGGGGGVGDDVQCTEFCSSLQKSMNSMLSEDVRVWNISRCPPPEIIMTTESSVSDNGDSESNVYLSREAKTITRARQWHVIYKATKKLYVYRLSMGPNAVTSDPLQRYHRVHIDGGEDISVEQLEKILKYYEGTHDFRAFAGAIEANQKRDGVENKDTVRTVYDVSLFDEGNGNYRIHILLKGALYKMVRNMVGTALDVCRGRLGEDRMLEMLHHSCAEGSKVKQFVRKDNKCKPAPPEGLTLENVYFEDDFF